MIPFPIFRRAKIACMIAYFNSVSLTGILYHRCQKNANNLLHFLHIFQKFYLPEKMPSGGPRKFRLSAALRACRKPCKTGNRATNWDLAACRRCQCVHGAVGIDRPLGCGSVSFLRQNPSPEGKVPQCAHWGG